MPSRREPLPAGVEMRIEPLACTGYSVARGLLCVHYVTGGSSCSPNDDLAYIDVAESTDEIFVRVMEAVDPRFDKLLALLVLCVLLPVQPGERPVRDANTPRRDERRGRRNFMRGAPVPRQQRPPTDCQDWVAADWEPRVGPQKWPDGTVHRRFLPPA